MILETLFDNLALKVDPFATCRVAEGWRLKLPCRDWVTLHFVLSGDGELMLGSGKLLKMNTSSLAIMPAGLKHAIQCGHVCQETGIDGQGDPGAPICELVAGSLDDTHLTVACGRIQVSLAGGTGLFDHLKQAIILEFEDTPQILGIFQALIREYQHSRAASAAMMAALMNQCLIEVLRRLSEENEGVLPWLSALDDPRLARVIEAVLNHPEQPHTLETLADVAHMSRSTFIRHFAQCFQQTPMDYLRDVRLRRAAQLLQVSGQSVDNIADQVGFASRSHFSRVFHDQFGCSPMEFRRQQH
jgi:AraC-like DNA-binding protein